MFITSNSIKVAPESVSSQIRAHPVARSCKNRRSTRVRYRLHLHKAIVFPLLRTRLPRTWRGCHSEFLRTLLSLFSRIGRGSLLLSISLRHFLLLSPFFSISNLPAACKHLHPVVRYLACIPAYYYTGLGLHITSPVMLAYLFQVKPRFVEYFVNFRNISRDATRNIKNIDHHVYVFQRIVTLFQASIMQKILLMCIKN